MKKRKAEDTKALATSRQVGMDDAALVAAIGQTHQTAQRQPVQAVNVALTRRNWLIGYHIIV